MRPGQVPAPLLAVLSGILSALAFPPAGLWPLVLAAPLPLLRALDGIRGIRVRQALLLGWIAGSVHFVLVLHWILALPGEEVTIPGLMVPALLFMGAYLGLFFGAASALAQASHRGLGLPLGAAYPLFATLMDAARSHGELAFPWGSLGYATVDAPALLQFTSITGYWGLVLWIYLLAGLCHEALLATGRRRALLAAAAFAVASIPLAHGSALLSRVQENGIDGPRGIAISLIQPNTSRTVKWDPRYREIVVNDLLERTREAAREKPDLIVWPETAAPIVLLQEPVYLEEVQRTVREEGIPLLAGTLDHRLAAGAYEAHNSAALFDSAGRIVDRYDKQRLVPFSERMPFQKILPWLSSLNFGQSDFSPGERNVIFPVKEARLACLICFESIFTDLARSFVASGADILVNITNDFWFGETAAPVQHAQMAVFRAVETRTPLVRCANTGISMVVDRWGRVHHATRTFVEARIDVRVEPASGRCFYVRHGDWLLRILFAAAAALGLAALASRMRGNR